MVLSNLARSLLVRKNLASIASIKQIQIRKMNAKFIRLTLLFAVLLADCSHSKSFNQVINMPVKKAIEDFEIYPDVIKTIPKDIVDVSYGNLEVTLGNELKPVQVKNMPTKIDYPFTAGKYYSLVMTDPDAPSRQTPTYREWHHWLVVNIPENKVNEGLTLSEYVGSGPPPKTGLHRYVYLVYEQNGLITPDEKKLTNKSAEGRAKFSIENFAKKYNLGVPIAANFYQAAYDDYVPELYKQLGEA